MVHQGQFYTAERDGMGGVILRHKATGASCYLQPGDDADTDFSGDKLDGYDRTTLDLVASGYDEVMTVEEEPKAGTFRVTVRETVSYVLEIEAGSQAEAEERAIRDANLTVTLTGDGIAQIDFDSEETEIV